MLTGIPVENGQPDATPEALALVAELAEEDGARGAEHAPSRLVGRGRRRSGHGVGRRHPPFGGTGGRADAAAVTVRLAVELPGWGEGALETLGRQAADELTPAGSAAELAATVTRWRPFTALPGFAEALVGRLGPAA